MSNLMKIEEFQVVEAYKDKGINIPKRATQWSAGYDIEAAEDIVVPSLFNQLRKYEVDRETIDTNGLSYMYKPIGYFSAMRDERTEPYSIEEMKYLVKHINLVTMIPTGLKITMDSDKYLALHPRSSMGVNCLLMLANQTGIIDTDYYNNEDNEGHIFVPMINLSPYDIKINKGDRIAQGIIQRYNTLDYYGNDYIKAIRDGGCGSTGVNVIAPTDGAKRYSDTNVIEEKHEYLGGTIKNTDPTPNVVYVDTVPMTVKQVTPVKTAIKVDHLYRPGLVTYESDKSIDPNTDYTSTTKAPEYSTKVSTADYPKDPDVVTTAQGSCTDSILENAKKYSESKIDISKRANNHTSTTSEIILVDNDDNVVPDLPFNIK